MVDTVAVRQPPVVHVVPSGQPQSWQHVAGVSPPVQTPSPHTAAVGAGWQRFDRHTSGLQQSAVTAQASFEARHIGGDVQTLLLQMRELQQSAVMAHAWVAVRQVGPAPPVPAILPPVPGAPPDPAGAPPVPGVGVRQTLPRQISELQQSVVTAQASAAARH
jgi:hypothetical protein